jgi:Lon protease-like protein
MIYHELPLFPLRTVLFPGQALPLHIFEPRYRQMIADCLRTDRTFGVVLIREGEEVGEAALPYEVGTTATIQEVEPLDDGRLNIVTIGQERFRLENYDEGDRPYLVGRVAPWPWDKDAHTEKTLSRTVQRRLGQYIELFSRLSDTNVKLDLTTRSPSTLAFLAAIVLQVPPEQKQALLEVPSVGELMRQLDHVLRQENQALEIMLASSHLQGEMEQPFSQN